MKTSIRLSINAVEHGFDEDNNDEPTYKVHFSPAYLDRETYARLHAALDGEHKVHLEVQKNEKEI
jgi:hypothetical protein